jgi:GMP synthase (glutamine-hydrolysing)
MKVTDVFEITGRGVVAYPGVSGDGPFALRIGQTVELRRPDGTRVQTAIRGIEHLNPNPNCVVPLLFNLSKSDLPVGTEIWITE